jgi:hypothetical protein
LTVYYLDAGNVVQRTGQGMELPTWPRERMGESQTGHVAARQANAGQQSGLFDSLPLFAFNAIPRHAREPRRPVVNASANLGQSVALLEHHRINRDLFNGKVLQQQRYQPALLDQGPGQQVVQACNACPMQHQAQLQGRVVGAGVALDLKVAWSLWI